jgi:hypothetical protein
MKHFGPSLPPGGAFICATCFFVGSIPVQAEVRDTLIQKHDRNFHTNGRWKQIGYLQPWQLTRYGVQL